MTALSSDNKKLESLVSQEKKNAQKTIDENARLYKELEELSGPIEKYKNLEGFLAQEKKNSQKTVDENERLYIDIEKLTQDLLDLKKNSVSKANYTNLTRELTTAKLDSEQ